MEKGISLYPGLGTTREELVGRVEQAAKKGMTRLFLSFHIPETNEAAFQKDIDALFEAARCYDLNVVGDLVPGRPIPEALTICALMTLYAGAHKRAADALSAKDPRP